MLLIKNIFREFRPLFFVAGPLIVNNLCIAGMQFADTVMSGMLGTQDLAGVAVGAQVWYLALMINLGLMMAISPIAARYFGSDNLEKIDIKKI